MMPVLRIYWSVVHGFCVLSAVLVHGSPWYMCLLVLTPIALYATVSAVCVHVTPNVRCNRFGSCRNGSRFCRNGCQRQLPKCRTAETGGFPVRLTEPPDGRGGGGGLTYHNLTSRVQSSISIIYIYT